MLCCVVVLRGCVVLCGFVVVVLWCVVWLCCVVFEWPCYVLSDSTWCNNTNNTNDGKTQL